MPKKMWAASINLSGLYSKRPIRVSWDEELETWWNKGGDFDVKKEGLDTPSWGCISFASTNKKEVEDFIEGASIMMELLYAGALDILGRKHRNVFEELGIKAVGTIIEKWCNTRK